MAFVKATKEKAKLRMAIMGPAGSGKTYTALRIATAMCSRVALVDTERGSAKKYSDIFSFDWDELSSYDPLNYVAKIREAADGGYDGLILDGMSPAWAGKDGALDLADKAMVKQRNNNKFTAWRDVTPKHNELIDAITCAPLHVFATVRTKMEYVQERDESTGKTGIRPLGMQPIQREGLEYEFDVVAHLDIDNRLMIGKTRCPDVRGYMVQYAGEDLAKKLSAWLQDGAEPVARASHPTPPPRVSARDEVSELIKSAENATALQALVPRIRSLPQDEIESVREEYAKRKAELQS